MKMQPAPQVARSMPNCVHRPPSASMWQVVTVPLAAPYAGDAVGTDTTGGDNTGRTDPRTCQVKMTPGEEGKAPAENSFPVLRELANETRCETCKLWCKKWHLALTSVGSATRGMMERSPGTRTSGIPRHLHPLAPWVAVRG